MQVPYPLSTAGDGWRAIQEPVLKARASHSGANGEGQAKDSLWAMILYLLELKLHNQGNTVLEDKFYINFTFIIHGSSCSVKALRHWSSSYWTIARRGNKGLGSGEPLVTAFFLTDQSIHNLILHVFLFKDTVFNTYHWLANIELMASTITHSWTKLM